MGMTIDEFEEYAKTHNILFMTKEFYEARLKADMVAMLTEIQLEIEEFMGTISPNYDEAAQDISKVIQQKINSLKAESEVGK